MKKIGKKGKILLAALGLGFVCCTLSSCTQSFCKNEDFAHMMFSYDYGITEYVSKDQVTDEYSYQKVFENNDNIYRRINLGEDSYIYSINSAAKAADIKIPSNDFYYRIDNKLFSNYWSKYEEKTHITKDAATVEDMDKFLKGDYDDSSKVVNFEGCGYLKFYNSEDNCTDLWKNYDVWVNEIRSEIGPEKCPSTDYINLYKNSLENLVKNTRTCITTREGGYFFGNFGKNKEKIYYRNINWGDAWGKGLLEGLIVFPVAWAVESMSFAFGLGGWGQVGAILVVTLIIRFLFSLMTLKPTLDQQKISYLQPQLQKIQAKYPNANSNKTEQQRLAMETQAFYKKNKVSMFSSLITLIIQFPLFLGVFGGMQGCAALSSDSIYGMNLSETPWSVLQNTGLFNIGQAGTWWTAFVLMFILTAFQVVSMFLPQWIQKYRSKKNPKLGKNPSLDQNAKRMRIFSIVMLIVLVFTSFGLTSGMCIYWLGGAIFNILQTCLMQFVILKKIRAKKGE